MKLRFVMSFVPSSLLARSDLGKGKQDIPAGLFFGF